MAGTLEVDITALRALEQRCRTLSKTFDDDTHNRVVGLIRQVRAPRLRNALDDFEEHGEDGREQVKRLLEGLVERLKGAIEQYELTEGDLVKQIDQSSQPQ